jgi:hypothetical protein
MNIGLGILGKIGVDDMCEVRDIDTARGDVGCDEKAELPFARLCHDALTLALFQIAVQPLRVETSVLQRLGYALGFILRVAEDDGGDPRPRDSGRVPPLVAAVEHVDEARDVERAT